AFDEAAAILLDRGPVEIAEPTAERDQVLVPQRLAAHQHHGVLVPSLHQTSERCIIERSKIEAGDLGPERATGRDHLDCGGGANARRLCVQSHGCLLDHCVLMFDTRMTFAHFANSVLSREWHILGLHGGTTVRPAGYKWKASAAMPTALVSVVTKGQDVRQA